MAQHAKAGQFLSLTFILVGFAVLAMPARAEADLTLTTRFIQGSFDILLPDGWVAALTAEGRVMEVQSPDRHKLSINARVRSAEEVAQARDFHLERLRDNDLLNVEIVGERRLLGDRLKITVVRPRFNEESDMNALLGPERLAHHLLATYHAGDPDGLWLHAGLVVFGEDALNEGWIDFMVATLESVRVSKHQSRSAPLYRRLKGASQIDLAEEDDLVGSWRTRDVVGKAVFAATSPSDAVLADGGLEELTFSADGRYTSTWSGYFLALEGGDLVAHHSEHRESGLWALRDGVLLLAPEKAVGRRFEDSDDKGEFVPAVTPQRSYGVTLRGEFPVLRGACPVFAEMGYCKDLYTGGRRVLDFLVEPIE